MCMNLRWRRWDFKWMCTSLLFAACWICSVHLFDRQADEARKYGARVYCVGIKDFDEQQVRKHARRMIPTTGSALSEHLRSPDAENLQLENEKYWQYRLLPIPAKARIYKRMPVYSEMLLGTHVSLRSSHPSRQKSHLCSVCSTRGASFCGGYSHLGGPAGPCTHKSVQCRCVTTLNVQKCAFPLSRNVGFSQVKSILACPGLKQV